MLEVNWDEKACIHAGECVKNLPRVFKVENDTLAIYEDQATNKEIKAVVVKCPSGALSIQE